MLESYLRSWEFTSFESICNELAERTVIAEIRSVLFQQVLFSVTCFLLKNKVPGYFTHVETKDEVPRRRI